MIVPKVEVIASRAGEEVARHTLGPGEYVIGREPGCAIVLDDEGLSRRHALLTINFDYSLIEDLGSSNGTFVNDAPVTECTRLWPNQRIRLGPAMTIALRRVKGESAVSESMAPVQAAVNRILPEEFLRDRKYDIGNTIARGGMGEILRAKEATTERTVAMKVMLNTISSADLVRFIAEAKVTAQLEHPNIVPIYELSVDENKQVFYTMRYVRGITLKAVLDGLAAGNAETVKKYPLTTLLTIYQKVCDAAAFAHSKGVIHRDLKPENVMLGDFGEVLVMDWGLAKVRGAAERESAGEPAHNAVRTVADPASSGDTVMGTVMGTPQYMAPEQARGEVETLDARCDIYSLGAILYYMLALRPALKGSDPMEVVERVAAGRIDPLTAPSRKRPLPDSLAAVVRKAMALDKEARYADVAGLQRDITAYQTGFATSAERAGLMKQMGLLIKRHKPASIGLAAVLLTALILGTRAFVEGERARVALAELRETAPTFYEQAQTLTTEENLPAALEKIGIALKLEPRNADYHAQRGNVLQSLERFREAADEYALAVRLNPREPFAAANAALSRGLADSKSKEGSLSVNMRTRWRDELERQGRDAEAILAGRTLSDTAKLLHACQAKINAWLGREAPRIVSDAEGFHLSLTNRGITDLSPLRGMPLTSIDLSNNEHLKDLGPLEDCPLTSFIATGTPDLTDISPLKGMQLKYIDISGSGVRDLSPLAGMPLEGARLNNLAIRDLSPLQGDTLKSLQLNNTYVRDLGPLAGQPLDHLTLRETTVNSLDPIGDAPLTYLEISSPFDVASLRAHSLRELHLWDATLDHPQELARMPDLEVLLIPESFKGFELLRKIPHLRKLDFCDNSLLPVEELRDASEFLREFDSPRVREARRDLAQAGVEDIPIKNLSMDVSGALHMNLSRTSISDIAPLHGLPIKELNLDETGVTDLSPLRGMPLTSIRLHGCPVKDVSPLADCPSLETIVLPQPSINVETLRTLKNLRYISHREDRVTGAPTLTAAEFWKQFASRQGGQKQ